MLEVLSDRSARDRRPKHCGRRAFDSSISATCGNVYGFRNSSYSNSALWRGEREADLDITTSLSLCDAVSSLTRSSSNRMTR